MQAGKLQKVRRAFKSELFMKQTDQEKIEYILREIENMKKIVAGKTADDLESDLVLERAVTMTLQIIGEKANQISSEFQEEHTEIEWRKIKGLRNLISHQYEDVNFRIVFDAATVNLPELSEQLGKINFDKTVTNDLLPRIEKDPSQGKKI